MAEHDFISPEIIARERAEMLDFVRDFPFFKLMGMELLDVGPGWSKFRMNWRADLTQPAGIMHGGAIAALIDTAVAHALQLTPTYLEHKPAGGRMVSLDLRVRYLRPVSSGVIHCEGKVVRLGRQISHTAATVTDEAGKDVALGDAIYMWVRPEQLRKK